MIDSFVTIDDLGFRREIKSEVGSVNKNNNINILVLGGSVVFGMTSQKGELPFPDVLEKELNKAAKFNKFHVYNGGVPGYGISSFKNILTKWSLLNPKFVVFYEGVNTIPEDVKGKKEHYNSLFATFIYNWYIKWRGIKNVKNYQGEEYKQGLIALLEDCKKIKATPILVTFSIPFTENSSQKVLAYWDVMQNGHSSAYAEAIIVKKHNQILRKIAQEENIPLVETTPFLNNKPEYFIDSTHFTQEGHNILANLVASKIEDLLK